MVVVYVLGITGISHLANPQSEGKLADWVYKNQISTHER